MTAEKLIINKVFCLFALYSNRQSGTPLNFLADHGFHASFKRGGTGVHCIFST